MPPEDQAPPSVADSLNAAIDTVEQSSPPPAEPAAPAEAPPADQTPAPAPRDGRDARGRFVSGKTADVPAHVGRPDAADAQAAPVDPKAPQANVDAPQAQVPPGVPAPDGAPPSWKAGLAEKWGKLDPDVRTEITRREREITTGLQRAADVRQFGDSIMGEFAPYAEILQQEGATPQAAIRALLETSYTLRYGSPEHKHALFMSLAQQYGIDPTKQIDPEKARLQWEVDSRNVNDARGATQAQVRLQQDVQSELEQFVQSPGHEHYERVRPAMAGLLTTGGAANLQDAYDRACWADPQIRQALQVAENTRRAQDQGKNRNAMLSVNGGPGAVAPASTAGADPSKLREFLEAQFTSPGGRV